ncbi:MAG: M81 family metallopeptidase [Trueperaceae bacterium]|nr:M81 family metallopeptidase [Trueperaceae bacterium]
MKIFVAGIITETNTFSPIPTGLADFEILRGNDIDKESMARAPLIAIREKANAGGHELVFSLSAFAQPAGLTIRSVYENLRDEFLADLKTAMPVDIVLLPLHGAMVAEGYDDCEGDMVAKVREIVGADVVIGVELDLHCHLSEQILREADLVVIYKEYPHIDMGIRAAELFDLAVATAEGKIKPTMAMFDCKMMGMYLTPFEPMRSFVDEMMAAEGKDGVLSLSLAHCFPWGDVADCGARMLAITDDDPEKATQVAESFGRKFFAQRDSVSLKPLSLDEALDKALKSDEHPIVIADQADNAGGGAPSDSTFVLKAMLERKISNAGIAMIYDPIAVQLAKSAGKGAKLKVRLGGKMGVSSGDPLDLDVTVSGIIDNMTQRWPQQDKDLTIQCGDSVCLSMSGIDIIVNSKRGQVFSPDVFSNFGIDVSKKKLLVVKSMQHFYAGYEPIAAEVIYMAAPGAVAPIMQDIPFSKPDLHKYPWMDNPFE